MSLDENKAKKRARTLFVISLVLYVIMTVISALLFWSSGDDAVGFAVLMFFFLPVYFLVGGIVYGLCALFNVIALIIVNVNKGESKGFKGILYLIAAVVMVLTYFVFLWTLHAPEASKETAECCGALFRLLSVLV